MITPATVDEVRDHTGTTPCDDDIFDALNRYPDTDPHRVERAALVILRRRLADMEAGPTSFSIEGDASWTVTDGQRAALRARIIRLERVIGDDENATGALPAMTQTPIMSRPGPRSAPPGFR